MTKAGWQVVPNLLLDNQVISHDVQLPSVTFMGDGANLSTTVFVISSELRYVVDVGSRLLI
jgi:hypothetical protein